MHREGMPVLQAQAGEDEEGVEEAQTVQAMSMRQLGVSWDAPHASQVRSGNIVYSQPCSGSEKGCQGLAFPHICLVFVEHEV